MSKRNSIKLDLTDTFRENEIIPMISYYGRYVLYGLAAVIALLLIFFRISSSRANYTEIDYINADHDFREFQDAAFAANGNPQAGSDYLVSLTEIVSRHADLQSKYDALIAETLIIGNQGTEAIPFANRSLQRTKNDQLPYYNDFAQTSLLIAQEKYSEALAQSIALQEKFNQSIGEPEVLTRGYSDQLYTLNLLRIASIYQVLDNKTAELDALNVLSQHILGLSKPASVDTKALAAGFTEGKATLNQYIELRKKTLNVKAKS